MDENPYAPPLSADFRQPENNPNYQPTKKQRVARIALSAFVFALSIALVSGVFILVRLIWKYPDFLQQIDALIMLVLLCIAIFLGMAILGSIFFIFTEYRFNKMKNKYIYILSSACIFYILFIFILTISFFIFDNKPFNFNRYLSFMTYYYSTDVKQRLLEFTEIIMVVSVAILLSFNVFSKHRKYYSNLSGSLK